MKKIPQSYVAYDYVYYVRVKNQRRLDPAGYTSMLNNAFKFIKADFPYFREIARCAADNLIASGKNSDALSLVQKQLGMPFYHLYEMKISSFQKKKDELFHYAGLLADSADQSLLREGAILLNDLIPELPRRIKGADSLLAWMTVLVENSPGQVLATLGKCPSIEADELDALRAAAYYKLKDTRHMWETVRRVILSKKEKKAAKLLSDFLELVKKDQKLLKQYAQELELILDETRFSRPTLAAVFSSWGIAMAAQESDDPGYNWLKKGAGFSEKVSDKTTEALCIYHLARLSYLKANYEGALYFTDQFTDQFQSHDLFPEMLYLRYRVFSIRADRENATELEKKIMEFPDSPFAYYLQSKKKAFSSSAKHAVNTFKPVKLDHTVKKEKFYHLFQAGFVSDAIRLLKDNPNRSKLYLGLEYYRMAHLEVTYPVFYSDLINDCCKRYQLDPALVLSVIREESRFDRSVVSKAGAKGLMQIMDDTYKWILGLRKKKFTSLSRLFEERENIENGCWYLRYLTDRFSGSDIPLLLVLASYNGGPGNVNRWLNKWGPDDLLLFIPFQETRNYLRKVFRSYYHYRDK
ncbi:MAG: lytic transglycosylase domain-containing protein [Candidatus Wallbacteria bacterium]|nr:lytic transglycosylase domain-containing protein [Candidatus Wallbacteria bacterium]